ncbi:hypothetical protein [Burkholderia ubonensis]|uniref:hypothetical protein n=1 Tax=Burkholderia ubonensis TaxID=101571 RepID=UPI0012FA43BE|nr:hypothetical protein [Burkholderia ubonensis]
MTGRVDSAPNPVQVARLPPSPTNSNHSNNTSQIAPAPAHTPPPRLPASQLQAEPVSSPVQSLSAAPPTAKEMYDESGTLNYMKMEEILREVKGAVRELNPNGGRASQDKIDRIIKDLRRHQGPELYDALKQLSFTIKRESHAEGTQALSAAVFQMARVHNYQLGLSRYDDAAQTIGRQIIASNPNLDTRSLGYVSDSIALGIRGSAKIGAQVANAEAGTVSAGINTGLSRSGMVTNDLDTAPLFITRGQANVNLTLNAAVGKLANNPLGTMGGGAGFHTTCGRLTEGETVQEVINHKVMHDREGGSFLTRAMAPSRRTLEAKANLATRGVTGRLGAMVRSVVGRITDGRFAADDPALNTHKLVKGAIAEGYLFGKDSLLAKFPACNTLQQHLESAYGGSPLRTLPSSLKPVVGTGDWKDVGGGITANIGLLDGQVAEYVNLNGLGVGGGITYNQRWLPYQLWMAPHAALDALADQKVEAKGELLERVLKADKSVAPYLDTTRSQSLEELQKHVKLFEDHAMNLLAAQGILRGYAHTPRDLSPPQVLLDHASARFAESLDELKILFKLSEEECKGVKPDSNKLEGLLARCWNRLSLSLAQASLRPEAATDPGLLKELAQRIERPNVLMAPEHLYHAAAIQMEKTFMRSRVVGNVGLALPAVAIGNANNQVALSLGTISGQVIFDHVTEHPNFVRNGDSLTFVLIAQHPLNLDIANVVPREIARFIAERFQSGDDKRQMNELDQAALLASLSEAYLTFGTDVASGGVRGSKSVQRQFEVSAHRSAKGEPWRLAYFQASNIKNSGLGASAEGGIALGVGGSVGGSAAYGRSDNLVMPPILGSAPSIHILQSPRFAQALLKQEEGRWKIDPDKLNVDKLRNADVAAMYFSNDAVLDMLNLLQTLKVDSKAGADVLGGLANLGHNVEQFAAFQNGGLPSGTLRLYIDIARTETKGMRMADRLKYFTGTEVGRALLDEYGSGIMQFAAMKSRAFMPYSGTDGRALRASILTASRDKQPLEMPRSAVDDAARSSSESNSSADEDLQVLSR